MLSGDLFGAGANRTPMQSCGTDDDAGYAWPCQDSEQAGGAQAQTLAFIHGNEVGEEAHHDREAHRDEHVAQVVHAKAPHGDIEVHLRELAPGAARETLGEHLAARQGLATLVPVSGEVSGTEQAAVELNRERLPRPCRPRS